MADLRTKDIHVKLSEREFDELKKQADAAGLSLSAYVRMVLVYGRR